MGSQSIINYLPKEYNASGQTWAITQDKRGIMYFGNEMGLLEFDGITWRLYQVSNKSVIRSLAYDDDGKLYAGASGDLGYFLPDSSGRLSFHSLMNFLPKDKRDFSDVWHTFFSKGKIYFNAVGYLFIWNIQKKEFTIIPSQNGFHQVFLINGNLYLREFGRGLEVLKNDSVMLVNGGEKFADERVYVMLPLPGDKNTILMGTRTKGLFKYDGKNFMPFKTEVDQLLNDNLIYQPGTILSDGNILLGTINGGSVIIDASGKMIRRNDLESGISNKSIYFTFQDRSGAVWLATENGISKIDYLTRISYFDSRNNFSSATYQIIRHNGIIYTASNDGIYILDPNTSSLHVIKNANSQSWCFLEMGIDLLAGTLSGLFKVGKDNLTPIRKTAGNEYAVVTLKRSDLHSNRIYVGTRNGLWAMIQNGNNWKEEGQLVNTNDLVNSIIEDTGGSIWIGTGSIGVYKLTPKKDEQGNIIFENPMIEHFDKTSGLQNGRTNLFKLNGINYFVTTDSIYLFNETKKIFYSDTSDKLISVFYKVADKHSVITFQPDSLGRIWIQSKDRLAMVTRKADGSYGFVFSPFNSISDEQVVYVYAEKNGSTWFSKGPTIVKYDFAMEDFNNQNYSALVRKVVIGEDSTIYFGGDLTHPTIPKIRFQNNAVKFWYSATNFEAKNSLQFKTFLEGFDKTWSSWSKEVSKLYTNLPARKYTFKIKALDLNGIESSIDSYSFEILPPWYMTWWAYLLYVLIIGSAIKAYVRYRSMKLMKENAILEEKIKKRTSELNQTIRDLQTTQTQLIQSEKMASLGELTAGIAHEIQNPLNFVNNFSEVNRELIEELSAEHLKPNAERDEQLENEILNNIKENEEKINHHGKRAGSIVKGMLQHSMVSRGQKELTDVNKIADEYLRLAYHGLRAKDKSFNATMKTDFDETIDKINIVPQDIGRVILNLINNAFYAVDERKKQTGDGYEPNVLVSTKRNNGKVEIKVSDNGNGVSQKVLDKIFQPFFTTKPTGQGTGLGLSLSYDIVKAHGGEIRVETKEGEGASFIILL